MPRWKPTGSRPAASPHISGETGGNRLTLRSFSNQFFNFIRQSSGVNSVSRIGIGFFHARHRWCSRLTLSASLVAISSMAAIFEVLLQWNEFLIILGAAIRRLLIIGNTKTNLKAVGGDLSAPSRARPWKKELRRAAEPALPTFQTG